MILSSCNVKRIRGFQSRKIGAKLCSLTKDSFGQGKDFNLFEPITKLTSQQLIVITKRHYKTFHFRQMRNDKNKISFIDDVILQ